MKTSKMTVTVIAAASLILGWGITGQAKENPTVVVQDVHGSKSSWWSHFWFDSRGQRPNGLITATINSQLARYGFRTINTRAQDNLDYDRNLHLSRAQEDSPRMTHSLATAYDAAYAVKYSAETQSWMTADNLCKAKTVLELETVTSEGVDTGLNSWREFTATAENCDQAVSESQVAVALKTGRFIAAKLNQRTQAYMERQQLDGGRYIDFIVFGDIASIEDPLGKLLHITSGVDEYELVRIKIFPRTDKSFMKWRVLISNETSPFKVKSNFLRMKERLLAMKGKGELRDIPFDYEDVSELRGLQLLEADNSKITFTIDRDLMLHTQVDSQYSVSGTAITGNSNI